MQPSVLGTTLMVSISFLGRSRGWSDKDDIAELSYSRFGVLTKGWRQKWVACRMVK